MNLIVLSAYVFLLNHFQFPIIAKTHDKFQIEKDGKEEKKRERKGINVVRPILGVRPPI